MNSILILTRIEQVQYFDIRIFETHSVIFELLDHFNNRMIFDIENVDIQYYYIFAYSTCTRLFFNYLTNLGHIHSQFLKSDLKIK